MSSKENSSLTAAAALAAADLFAISQGGNSRKLTGTQLAEFIRDTIGATLTAGEGVTLTVDDASDTITIAKAFRGCRVTKSSTQSGVNFSTSVAVTWDTETVDTDSIHDNSSNTDRLTVPTGVTLVEVGYDIICVSVTSSNTLKANITKGGVDVGGWSIDSAGSSSTYGTAVSGSTGPIAVVAGDIFRIILTCVDTSIDVANISAAWMKILK